MLIDWFTVVAEIVNFLVLVALLKHFLFGRLVAAIDARENRIAKQVADAEKKDQEAQQRCEKMRLEGEEREREREQMLAEAREEANRQRDAMVEKAREAVRALEARWHEDLEHEKGALLDEIRRRAAKEILDITRRALSDLASADVEHCALEAFLAKLQTLDPASITDRVVLRSAAEVSPETRHQIEDTLHRRFGERVQLDVERAPDLAWGIELRANGRRIGWNPDSYIESLEENLRKALDENAA